MPQLSNDDGGKKLADFIAKLIIKNGKSMC